MICKNCFDEIPVRLKGRGRKRTDFCSDGCMNAWNSKAHHAGIKVLRRRRKVALRQAQGEPRRTAVEKMEAEAEAAGCPGMYLAGGSWRRAPDLRRAPGNAALRMGVIGE